VSFNVQRRMDKEGRKKVWLVLLALALEIKGDVDVMV
jgi:hypothetical protein